MLRRLLRGHGAGHWPDNSSDVARMNTGNNGGLANGQPPDNRRIAGVSAGLIQIRGWCLTKMTGFRFQKADRDSVRLNVTKLAHGWAIEAH
jgi:hypothetical protein